MIVDLERAKIDIRQPLSLISPNNLAGRGNRVRKVQTLKDKDEEPFDKELQHVLSNVKKYLDRGYRNMSSTYS